MPRYPRSDSDTLRYNTSIKGWPKALKEAIAEKYETGIAVLSIALGLIAAVVATYTAADEISETFYATIAQVLPVFLIALAVEQRLVDRLGMSEEEYARRANQALHLAVKSQIAWEGLDEEEAKRLETLFDSQREFAWVGLPAMEFVFPGDPEQLPDIELMARRRYRNRRRNEAVFVIAAIVLLVFGEGAALGGMLQGGTMRCSPYLTITVMSTVGTFLAITLGGARELARSIRL